jgi:NAD(P)-dependent dehydrogenase (short-subunit alcohol dehydrogenase family)
VSAVSPAGGDDRLTVVVTGANRGIGLGLARSYAVEGHRVVATVRAPGAHAELEELSADHDVEIAALDLGDPVSIAAFGERVAATPIDVLYNNAGTMGPEPLLDSIARQRFGSVDLDLWLDVLRVNTLGTVALTEQLVDSVAASRRRTIVMVSSTTGSIAASDRTALAYTTSKTALNKASTIIARAVEPLGVVVLVVCPGHVRTRLGLGGGSVEVDESVAGLRRLVDSAGPADSGTFRRFSGETIPW